ncbi:MAG: thioredoxin domain-containing protein [Gemmatimonadaceae bacterium]
MAAVAIVVGIKVLSEPKSGVRQVTVAQGKPKLTPIADTGDVYRFAMESETGVQSGSSQVDLVEFFDIECPFCANYSEVLDSAQAILRDTLFVRFAHMPLRIHRFARQGAMAAECAHQQGVAARYVRAIYQNQDSIGIRSWAHFGNDAGVRDTVAFESCRTSAAVAARIDSARDAASALGIPGTPTIWLNGWQYSSPPDLATLLRDIRRFAAERRQTK